MKYLLLVITITGCTNAQLKQFGALGNKGHLKCYSGGQLIYEGHSTGKIHTEAQSDGWFFEEEGTNKLIRISGDCLISN